MMRVTMLGCGPSTGVPVLGSGWGACDPANPRNRRRRCSVLVEKDGYVLLVDTAPDMRDQLLDAGVGMVDAVLYTHAHADHIHGADDLRSLHWKRGTPIDIYGDADTLTALDQRFGYLFRAMPESPPHFKPPLVAHRIGLEPFTLGGILIEPYRQSHGHSGESLGFVFDRRFAYSTDVAELSDADFARLAGIELWFVDCLRIRPSAAHAHLEKTLAWIDRVRPGRAVLTHMNAQLDYAATLAACPPNAEPGYDGLAFELG